MGASMTSTGASTRASAAGALLWTADRYGGMDKYGGTGGKNFYDRSSSTGSMINMQTFYDGSVQVVTIS